MAQLAQATKVRNQAGRNTKVKAAKAAQAKAMSAVAGMVDNDDKVVDIKGTALTTQDTNLPVIALSSIVDPANPKRYQVTTEQTEYVQQMIDGDIGPAIAGIRKNAAELTWTVACISVALAVRLMKSRNEAMPLVERFLAALAPIEGQGIVRTNAIKSWLEAKAPVTWGKNNLNKTAPLFDKDKHKAQAQAFGNKPKVWIAERLATPFWTVKPEAAYASFDFAAALAAIVKRAEQYATYTPEQVKEKFTDKDGKVHLNLDGLDDIKKAMAKSMKVAAPDNAATDAEDKAKAA